MTKGPRGQNGALVGELATLTSQGADLDRAIAANLAAIGFPIVVTKASR